MGYLTISTNVRRYQTRHIWQPFLPGRQRTGSLCAWVTQSNWVKMWFSRFPVLQGSAEAQVTWGGIAKHVWLPALSVIFLPKISKSIHVCQSYNKPTVRRFLRHGVYRETMQTHNLRNLYENASANYKQLQRTMYVCYESHVEYVNLLHDTKR